MLVKANHVAMMKEACVWKNYWVQIAFASLFLSLTAQISISLGWTPVPLTGQTLGLLLVARALGPQRGFMATLVYLIQGAMGAPVFASGNSGIFYLLGPTGGYLLCAPVFVYLFGWLLQFRSKMVAVCLASLVPPILLLTCGVSYLSNFIGLEQSFFLGFLPFFGMEIGKAFCVAFSAKWWK